MPPPEDDEQCANPLLLSWVKEWLDVARERNSKGVLTYRNAYNALKACPITFSHPCQLQELRGFGPKLCDRLTEKLQQHCAENGLSMPRKKRRHPGQTGGDDNGSDHENDDDQESRPQPKKPRKTKAYVPKYRSGPYAIIMGLADCNASGTSGLSKQDLIEVAQPYCDASFTAPEHANSFYTAWNSINTLINKEIVIEKRGGPSRKFYVLTDVGMEIAGNMRSAENAGAASHNPAPRAGPSREFEEDEDDDDGRVPLNRFASVEAPDRKPKPMESAFADVVKDGGESDPAAIPNFRPIRLQPGSFTVELVLDTREIRSRTDRDYMSDELRKKGVKPIQRNLELGDALWVAKCNDPQFLSRTGAEGDEVVLDWILERKRLDDLISSIKDGRFHEQKFRLKRSGVKNVVYLVEEFSIDDHNQQRYEEAVQSAIATTQVVNGFFVKQTQKMDDTIRYLARLTTTLKKRYEGKPLFVIPTGVITQQNYLPLVNHLREKEPSTSHHVSYPAFASLASKSETMTLRDLYLKFLMCSKGVTGEKAMEIQRRWKTPHEFVKAFEDCGSGEAGKKQRKELVYGQLGGLMGRKKVTRPLSQRIAEVWGNI
jgi:crossover junction endonuclease MUS81